MPVATAGPTRLTEAMLGDSVLSHARTDFAKLRPEWTVAEALEALRGNEAPNRIVYFYVADADDTLLGVIPTRRLLYAKADATIAEIMIRNVIAIPANATVLDACEFFTMYRLLAFPVVGPDRHLLGVIDIQLYTDELTETGGGIRDNLFQLVGVHLAAANQTSPLQAFRGRFPWLMCNVTGGTMAAVLSSLFERELSWNGAILAMFVMVVLAVSESVSIQSVTLALQRAEGGGWRKFFGRIVREGSTGLLLGLGTATLVAIIAWLWKRDVTLTGIVFLGLSLGVAVSACVGYAVPTVLKLLKREPQVAAGPIALVSADLCTLLIYFTVGRVLIG
jgi:magnesium transporter